MNEKVSEFGIINLPGMYCLDGIKEKGEAECFTINVSLKNYKGEFYWARKDGSGKFSFGEPGEWIELLKRDGNKIYLSRGYFSYKEYFFLNNFEITAQKNHIIITNYYGKGNSKKYNLVYRNLQ